VPVPYFLLFCVSEKLHKKYSWNWTKQKPKCLFFPIWDGVQSRDEGGPGARRTIGWRGLAPGRATRWCAPWPTSWHRPSAYIFSSARKPKGPINSHETYCKPPPSLMRDREGPEALPGTLPERGITVGVLLHHHAYLQSDTWVVYLGLRVHSSS
jgi:hypothetical protein